MRENILPDNLHNAGIVLSGAIIVFDSNQRRAASFIPGTLWVGSLELDEDYTLDSLPGTIIQPRATLETSAVITAAQRFSLWQTISHSDGKKRILTAIDAFDGFTGYYKELAVVCGMDRRRILSSLQALVACGLVIRTNPTSTQNKALTFTLPAASRGTYWLHRPKRSEVAHLVSAQKTIGFNATKTTRSKTKTQAKTTSKKREYSPFHAEHLAIQPALFTINPKQTNKNPRATKILEQPKPPHEPTQERSRNMRHTILAFDPGPMFTRYCLLAGDKNQQQYLKSGSISSNPERLKELIANTPATGYAIETMGRFAPKPEIVLSLLRTAEIAGTIIGLATSTGKPVFTMPANAPKGKPSWRVLLCGARDGSMAGDNTVKWYLHAVLPTLPENCDVHERDAAGLGVVALKCSMQPQQDPEPTTPKLQVKTFKPRNPNPYKRRGKAARQ